MTDASAPLPDPAPNDAPRTLGGFQLLRKLGQGGMAEVWLAEQSSLERRVALKLLRRDLMQDEKYVARFQREASAAGALNHPNIVQVHTVGEEGGQHYIAQEYVKGVTLKAYLKKKGPPDVPLALHIMRQVASALKAAGDAGIVHRDIKPENIMLTSRGEVKVADFGLAQLYSSSEGVDITQEGMTMGTPLYMSPEQVHGHKLDPRSDIYSFGVTCYHMLAGRPPFDGPTAMSIAVKHVQEPAPSLSAVRPDLPEGLVALVDKMLAKEPERRYPHAGELLADIRRIQKSTRSETLNDDELVEAITSAQSRNLAAAPLSRRAGLTLITALFIISAAASAAIGWVMRPPSALSAAPPPANGTIRRQDSAREQYVEAMLIGDNPDAFQAVIDFWSVHTDRIWIRRAQEQLALLYLRDRERWNDAEKMLTTIESYAPENPRFAAEAWAGRAALRAYQGRYQEARNILQSQLRSSSAGGAPLKNQLPQRSPFRQLLHEAETIIEEQHK